MEENDMVIRNNVSKLIVQYTTENNISLQEFAEKCGISKTNIYGYVSKKSTPNKSVLNKIAKFINLDVNVFYIMGNEANK